jgi:cell division protein FtsB
MDIFLKAMTAGESGSLEVYEQATWKKTKRRRMATMAAHAAELLVHVLVSLECMDKGVAAYCLCNINIHIQGSIISSDSRALSRIAKHTSQTREQYHPSPHHLQCYSPT